MEDQNADVKQNEQVLGQLLDQADKKFVSLVGVMSLSLLTEQMPADEYQAFLSSCINNALELQKHKMLNGKQANSVTGPD